MRVHTRQSSEIGTTTITYEFDARGNRTLMTVEGTGIFDDQNYFTAYEYDLNNRLLTETRTETNTGILAVNVVEITDYTYDANGNQLTRFTNTLRAQNDPLSVIIFAIGGNNAATRRPIAEVTEYNVWNQIVSVVNTNYTVYYTYLPNGMRHSKTVSGRNISGRQTTTHVWDGMHIVAELNNHGNVQNLFIRGIGLIRSHHHGWYLHNARTDVIQRVNDDGEILHTYRYNAFGAELAPCEDNTNPFRFSGEYWDFATGTYYLRGRAAYDPHTGRFTQPDPFWGIHNMTNSPAARMQSGNLYAYVMNNPVLCL